MIARSNFHPLPAPVRVSTSTVREDGTYHTLLSIDFEITHPGPAAPTSEVMARIESAIAAVFAAERGTV